MMKIPVSIIVPIYGVEKYIERCVRSLFEQSLHNIEYIFVNDCTKDCSMDIVSMLVKEYEMDKLTIKIVSHEINRGLAAARNSGLAVALGEYIYHCDADDWIEKDAMEKMYNLAQDRHADLVWCDWFLSFKNNERYMKQQGEEVAMGYLKDVLAGNLKFNVWNKLVKRNLYLENAINFPTGNDMGEDMTMIKVISFAEKVAYLPEALYHYLQLNMDSYTKRVSEKRLSQISYNANGIIDFIEKRYQDKLERELQLFKLNVKLPFLITDDRQSYQRWLDWYPEANDYITKDNFPFRIRFIQKAAVKRQFWIVTCYYYLVMKVMYGIVYK